MRVAVIDIGSNSSRVVVFEREATDHLRVLAGTRAALRLVHDVDEGHRLSDETMAAAMEAFRDFRAIAHGAGAKRIAALATAAMREAANGPAFIARIRRELGITVDIIDGRREAHYGLLGAVGGLAVESGLLFDLGGGSLQLSHFRRRKSGRATSLPLGALRLSQAFLESDPPRPREMRRLRDHVARLLERTRLARLRPGESLLGTGGTLRNLAKIDQRARRYPTTRLHGYVLGIASVRETAARLAATRLGKRDRIPGLSAERADSIVGGALAIETLMEIVDAPSVLVSGQGVREGLVYSLANQELPAVAAVQESSLRSLTARFRGWSPEAAKRRRVLTSALLRQVEPDADGAIADALDRAAQLLDIGRSIDFFNRHEHAAHIVLATELDGFTHEEIALLGAMLQRAGDGRADLERLRPLVRREDVARIERAAVLLVLADDIEERCRRGARMRVSVKVTDSVVVRVTGLEAWRPRGVGARFERAFGKSLEVIPGGR